jgi:hypothetical protein
MGAGDGPALRLQGKSYSKGLGVHANSVVTYTLNKQWTSFKAEVGVDDAITSPRASVVFEVVADGQSLFKSNVLRHDSAAVRVEVDVTNRQILELRVTGADDGMDFDHGNWADARLERTCPPAANRTVAARVVAPVQQPVEFSTPLRVYPNPAADEVTVMVADGYRGTLSLDLLNARGERVYHHTGAKADEVYQHRIAVRPLSAGLYLIQVREAGQLRTQRLIVKP